jgi:hypothetical protein
MADVEDDPAEAEATHRTVPTSMASMRQRATQAWREPSMCPLCSI